MRKVRNLVVSAVCILMMAPVLVYAGGSIESHIEAYVNYVNLVVDGEHIDADTIIYESTTYVPIRAVAEFLGKEVSWDEDTKTASIEDYPFLLVDEAMVEGEWESVDYVDNFGEFSADSVNYSGELYLTGITFTENNKVGFELNSKQMAFVNEYIGDVIIHTDNTVNRFYIQEIEEELYMFYEWDGSDGVHKDMTPDYYVLKKVPEQDVTTGLEDLDE